MITRGLVKNCLKTSINNIPKEVLEHGKKSILNWIGVAIGAASHESADILTETALEYGGKGRFTIFGREEKVDLPSAVLINGMTSHIFDYDDTHLDTIHHPSGPVAPVVLALGEERNITGEEVLRAFILGCEAELRISNAVYPSHYDKGWHITSSTGVFGSAIAAGILLGLDEEKMLCALGIAGTQSFGLRESFGTMTKPYHPGKAAQNGLMAALMAEKGFTASHQILEAKRGFANVLSEGHTLAKVNKDWGHEWEMLKNTFKPYACGIVLHPAIDACIHLKEQKESVEEIRILVNPYVKELTGKRTPETGLEGKFSIYFAASVAYLEGEAGFRQFTDEKVKDVQIREMMTKIIVDVDSNIEEDQVELVAVLTDGRKTRHIVSHAKGSLEKPLTREDLLHKFHDVVGENIEKERREEIIQHILNLENESNIRKWISMVDSNKKDRSWKK